MDEKTVILNTCLRKTVLVVLTSFGSNFSTICLPCLERSVNLSLFKKIYILANCVLPEHAAKLKVYEKKFRNMQCVFYGPKGLHVVTKMFEAVLELHREDIILKIDDDVFISKNCIKNLMEAYYQTVGDNSVSIVTPLIWNNGACLHVMKKYLVNKYPSAADKDVLSYSKGLCTSNVEACDFLWSVELSDRVMQEYSKKTIPRIQYTTHYLSINCVVFDSRLTNKAIPFCSVDEKSFNSATVNYDMRFAIDTSSLAYHYSFGPLKKFMLAKYPLKRIEEHVLVME